MDFKETLRHQWNEACLQLGLPSLTIDTAAKIMAVLYQYGNNEHMVLNNHFQADCHYIQKRFHIQGGETPDKEFVKKYNMWLGDIMEYERTHPEGIVPWAVELFNNMYNIKLLR